MPFGMSTFVVDTCSPHHNIIIFIAASPSMWMLLCMSACSPHHIIIIIIFIAHTPSKSMQMMMMSCVIMIGCVNDEDADVDYAMMMMWCE